MTVGTATITVESIKPAPAPNRSAGAKDTSGGWFDFWPNKIQVEAGKTYDVEYSTRDWQGKTYRTIQKATAHATSVAQAAAPVIASVKPNGAYHAPDKNERMIFITGLAGRMLGSGRYRIDQMPDIVLGAAWCWNELCEHPEGKKPELEVDPMGDAYEGDLPEMRG